MYDVAIVGGGIVGLATAFEYLQKNPFKRLIVIEKEPKVASHQTGNNSGVIHSGIYYKLNSLKAINCRRGVKKLLQFCDKYNIQYDLCGKIIIATKNDEIPRLDNLFQRGMRNGVTDLEMLDENGIEEIEPFAKGIKGIYSPSTGIVDYKEVSNKCAELIKNSDSEIKLNCKVLDIVSDDKCIIVETEHGVINTKSLINCSGLFADRIAKMTEDNIDIKIIPFRGEYYKLKDDKTNLVNSLIYTVPDPKFPFLGVHFTRKIDGTVEAGPNAILAFAREGYKKSDFNFRDLSEIMLYPAFWKLGKRYWKIGSTEMIRSYSKNLFVRELKKLIPEITSDDIVPGGSGVRAQALTKEGKLLDDFKIIRNKNIVHVLNAPSPAATSAFAIAENIISVFEA